MAGISYTEAAVMACKTAPSDNTDPVPGWIGPACMSGTR